MVCHGVSWCAMVCHGVPWCVMVCHGVSWCVMVCHGVPWCPMVWHGVAWCGMVWHVVCRVVAMVCHGVPRGVCCLCRLCRIKGSFFLNCIAFYASDVLKKNRLGSARVRRSVGKKNDIVAALRVRRSTVCPFRRAKKAAYRFNAYCIVCAFQRAKRTVRLCVLVVLCCNKAIRKTKTQQHSNSTHWAYFKMGSSWHSPTPHSTTDSLMRVALVFSASTLLFGCAAS
jgi:hypothetical protein